MKSDGLIYPDHDATMYFRYGRRARPGIVAKTTFDAVLSGERTATTRQSTFLADWRPGQIVRFWSGKQIFKGKSVLVRILSVRVVQLSAMSPEEREEWSRLEGWSVDTAKAFSIGLLSGRREQVIFKKLEQQNP
jgi:hypothetical protein